MYETAKIQNYRCLHYCPQSLLARPRRCGRATLHNLGRLVLPFERVDAAKTSSTTLPAVFERDRRGGQLPGAPAGSPIFRTSYRGVPAARVRDLTGFELRKQPVAMPEIVRHFA